MPEDERTWATTEEVKAAAKVRATSTVFDWVKRGVLPEPEIIYRGRHGKTARWALHAPAQAEWVARKIAAGFTLRDIRTMLERSEFTPHER